MVTNVVGVDISPALLLLAIVATRATSVGAGYRQPQLPQSSQQQQRHQQQQPMLHPHQYYQQQQQQQQQLGQSQLLQQPPYRAPAPAAGVAGTAPSGEHQINARPIFKPTPKNVTVGPGDRAVLRCRVENLGTKTVTWKKFDEVHPLTIGLFPFAPDSRISVDFNQRLNEWSLIIQDVRPVDEGVYQCQISTKDDQDSYDITLNVKNIQLSGTEYVDRMGTIQLICNATGKLEPPHDVEWFKDGVKINSDSQSGIIITKKIETKVLISMLVIRNSRPSHSGEYICRASTHDSGSFRVHVVSLSSPVEKRESYSERITSNSNSVIESDYSTSLRKVLPLFSTSSAPSSFARGRSHLAVAVGVISYLTFEMAMSLSWCSFNLVTARFAVLLYRLNSKFAKSNV